MIGEEKMEQSGSSMSKLEQLIKESLTEAGGFYVEDEYYRIGGNLDTNNNRYEVFLGTNISPMLIKEFGLKTDAYPLERHYAIAIDKIPNKCFISLPSIIRIFEKNKTHTVEEKQMNDANDKALRYNSGKPRFDWIPPEVEEALASILTASQGEGKKYPARNWEKGMSYMTCYASLRRHLNKWVQGVDVDEESGQPHLHHVLWNIMALVTYDKRGIGEDDRIKIEEKAK